ncbi:uncharacterized protein [Montipora capricornis]|uniref:uncharacterized protein n=1 Tax=Montipora capricornis TaxID=246305 RepID=UPI0035F10691
MSVNGIKAGEFIRQIIKSLLVSLYEVAVLVLLVSATNLDITAGLLGKEKVFETFNATKQDKQDRITSGKVLDSLISEKLLKAGIQDILKSRDSVGDGEYWINPEGNGNSMKVYCDMTIAGGGWLLVFNVVVEDSKSLPTIAAQDSYRKIDNFRSNALFLTNNALNELRKFLAFTQMRFHCHKPGNRTFHVATIINSTGEAVIQFFTGQTIQMPTSCGSFIPLPDDNSILAGECAKWGKENENFHVGKWSHQGRKGLWDHLAMIGNIAHWNIVPPRWECDDFLYTSTPDPHAGSFWKVYVR